MHTYCAWGSICQPILPVSVHTVQGENVLPSWWRRQVKVAPGGVSGSMFGELATFGCWWAGCGWGEVVLTYTKGSHPEPLCDCMLTGWGQRRWEWRCQWWKVALSHKAQLSWLHSHGYSFWYHWAVHWELVNFKPNHWWLWLSWLIASSG